MTELLTVDVTQEDIDAARAAVMADPLAFRNLCCPIAQAIRRQLGPDAYVRVIFSLLSVGRDWYDLPEEVDRFVMDFDAGKEVHPLRFEARASYRSPAVLPPVCDLTLSTDKV